ARDTQVAAKRLLLKGRYTIDRQIVRCAELTGADLIVMGTHGRTGVLRMLVGSVASRVIARSRIPVLVIRALE
ncbi:MAG: universal stress protein, partial [Candidatus Binatia bacterium]